MRETFQSPLCCLRRLLTPGAQVVAAITALIAVLPLCAQTKPVGSVEDIDERGNWFVYENADAPEGRKLTRWQHLPAGGVIRNKAPKAGDHLQIVDDNLRVLASKKCESANSCYEPIYLPREPKEAPGELTAFFRRILARLSAEDFDRSMHRTRAAGVRLEEGVVAIVNGRADLRKLMEHMPGGKYTLESFKPGGGSAKDALKFEWSGKSAEVPLGNRKPGIYEISLSQTADADSPVVAASVRVLLCNPKDYANLSASFQQVQGLTNQWGSTVTPAVHDFLREYLTELAGSRQIPGKP